MDVRKLQLTCAALLLGHSLLLSQSTFAAASTPPAAAREQGTHLVVLSIDGRDAAGFEPIARELLTRIDVLVVGADEAASVAPLLHISVSIDGESGGFVARRQSNGPIVARADMHYETSELLREALAHSLLSLVEAVVQGQPVPEDLQARTTLGSEVAPEPTPETHERPNLESSALPTPPAAPARPAAPAGGAVVPLHWRVTAATTASLSSETRPRFGASVRAERELNSDWSVGARFGLAQSPEFVERAYAVSMRQLTLQALAAWRAFELGETRLLLVSFAGVSLESAEALRGDGALSGPQREWLTNFGLAARVRRDLNSVSLEAELGVRAYPLAPRLVVRAEQGAVTLFEPWVVQPELGLGVGVSF